MARHFDGTSHLWAANTGYLAFPYSVFFWVKTAGATFQTAFYSGSYQYNFDGLVSVTQAQARYSGGSPVPGRQCHSTTTFPVSGADEWHQVVLLFTNLSLVKVYVDGNYAGNLVDSATENVGNVAHVVWGAGYYGGPGLAAGNLVGDLADLCLWSGYILTEAQIASLKNEAIRPNQIQPANVTGYWPLPESGDLSNLAGGTTFGALSNVNGATVSPDPPYTLPPTTTTIARPAHARRSFEPVAATDPAAPSRDRLALWYPGTRPHTEVWSNCDGNTLVTPFGAVTENHFTGSQDNSIRRNFAGAQHMVAARHVPSNTFGVPGAGQTYTCWLKIFTFNQSIDYWNGAVNFYSGQTSGAWNYCFYMTNATAVYGHIGKLAFSRFSFYNYQDQGCISTQSLPLDQWAHAAIVCNLDGSSSVAFYINGQFAGASGFTAREDIPWSIPIVDGILGLDASIAYGRGDFAMKDFRIYDRALNANQIFDVYLHSLEFHNSTSCLIRTEIFPLPLEIGLLSFPRLQGSAGLRPVHIKATKATLHLGRIAGSAGIRPAVVRAEQLVRLFRLAGAAGLRTVQVKAQPKLTIGRMAGTASLRALRIKKGNSVELPRLTGSAFLRPWILQSTRFLEFPRMMGFADLRGIDFRIFRGFWHEELAGLYANQIERERRVLLGKDSTLELYTQRGTASELRKILLRDFSVYHVSSLGGPEEWFCDLLEDANPWETMREITEIRVKTHGQGIVYKVIALERPVEKGHCYRLRLQATGDPRI